MPDTERRMKQHDKWGLFWLFANALSSGWMYARGQYVVATVNLAVAVCCGLMLATSSDNLPALREPYRKATYLRCPLGSCPRCDALDTAEREVRCQNR